jgi:hypothetical protein
MVVVMFVSPVSMMMDQLTYPKSGSQERTRFSGDLERRVFVFWGWV